MSIIISLLLLNFSFTDPYIPTTQHTLAQAKAEREADPLEGVTVPHNIDGVVINVPYFPYTVLHQGRCYHLSNSRYGSDRNGVLRSEPAWLDDKTNRYSCGVG